MIFKIYKEATMAMTNIVNWAICSKVTLKRVVKALNEDSSMEDSGNVFHDFIKDFKEEGWCHEELSSAIYTLFHLDDSLRDYAEYWF